MKHYKQEEWADYTRGLAVGASAAAMKAHLESGCNACQESVQVWQLVQAAALREASYAPPSDAVRVAKSYAAQGLPKAEPSWLTQVAELVFDSKLEPAVAGLRNSAAAAPQQLLYTSGDYSIDLRIEGDLAVGSLWVAGQILSKSGQSVRSVPVTLVSELGPLATATTNPYGEFHLEFRPHTALQLSVRIGTAHILIPVSLVVPPSPPIGGSEGRRGGGPGR